MRISNAPVGRLKVLTVMHLSTARSMPRKSHLLWLGENDDRKYRRAAKRERKAIARYYWALRRHPEEGKASVAHRYGVVTCGSEARIRLRALEPAQ